MCYKLIIYYIIIFTNQDFTMLAPKLVFILLLAVSNTLRVIHNSHHVSRHLRHLLHN